MDQDKQAFSEVFPDGILNIESADLREDEKEFLRILLKNLRWNISEGFLGDIIPGSKEVYVDYINSNSHNAQANVFGFKAIGINYGLVLNLYKISAILLNCKELFEDLDFDSELYSIEDLKPLFENSFEEIPDLRMRTKPVSEQRTMMASIVARIAFYFVIGHELSHVNNHRRIIPELIHSGFISEFYSDEVFDSETIFNLRTLELDADRNGALVSFWLAIQFYQAEDSLLYDLYPGPSYVWMVSILSVLFSFEKGSEFYYPNKTSYHPVAYIRQSFCLQFIRGILDNPDFVDFFGANYKPDFNLALVNDYEGIELFFGELGSKRNPTMELEFKNLIENLRILQSKF
ncbi:MAG: hypothetical protein KDC69_08880 [Flavobacteriaceae bacterium]|nr:hypothetical protein [Flavobacteriaceae bacterium]MCB0705286.1 hypothetical protein [Saprospiraceae bacterium]